MSARPSDMRVGFTSELGLAVTGGTATRLGPWVRVEVIDTGNDDRPVAIAAARGG